MTDKITTTEDAVLEEIADFFEDDEEITAAIDLYGQTPMDKRHRILNCLHLAKNAIWNYGLDQSMTCCILLNHFIETCEIDSFIQGFSPDTQKLAYEIDQIATKFENEPETDFSKFSINAKNLWQLYCIYELKVANEIMETDNLSGEEWDNILYIHSVMHKFGANTNNIMADYLEKMDDAFIDMSIKHSKYQPNS